MTQTQVYGVQFLQSCQSTSLSCIFTKHVVCLGVRKENEGGKIQKDAYCIHVVVNSVFRIVLVTFLP